MFRIAKSVNVSIINSVNWYSRCFSNIPQLHVSEEVRNALESNKPVIALESTIITHGMPFPQNVECAKEVENIVREQGATPATIAIINGQIKVGLTEFEIATLGDTSVSKPIKTSRRDFSYVISHKLNGGTTVSGTVLVANKVGIPIFATGGIGGVHREVNETFDVSADLIELGKSNIAVVSSGVKSILDIPKTLEYLETHGVFVATFGDSKDFPAFYTTKSSYKAPYNVTSSLEAAKLIKANKELQIESAMLFAVPVPQQYSLEPEIIDKAIDEALYLAKNKFNISGKEITPFILSQVAKITEGKSLKTNIALIKNNAKVSSLIASELGRLEDETVRTSSSRPVIIGGSNLDTNVILDITDIKLDGRIHFGKFRDEAGGVGRNLCESLYKLGFPADFITALGCDESGHFLRQSIPEECTNCIHMIPDQGSARCIIVFDKNRDCKFLLGDVDIHKQLNPDVVMANEVKLKDAPLIVMDANLSLEAMDKILEIAQKYKKPVFYEPTDVEISTKPFLTSHGSAVKFITPNLAELKFIASHFNIIVDEKLTKLEQVATIAKQLGNHVENLIVTLGEDGLVIARKGLANEPFGKQSSQEVLVRHYPVTKVENIVNVSGAGDSLASGMICGILTGLSEEVCVTVGVEAAKTALKSQSTVAKELFDRSHASWNKKSQYINL